jgi:hypothetical protein
LHGRDHTERPLRADQQVLQVVAGDVLARPAADVNELAWSEHDLEAGHPRAGHAVLQRVRAAGVRRDVAADLRLLRGARVRPEEQAVLAREAPHVARAHTGLRIDPPQRRLELAHAAQALERDDDTTSHRHRAAEQPSAAAACDDRHVVRVAPAHDFGDLSRIAREHDRIGMATDSTSPRGVAVVGRHSSPIEHTLWADQPRELGAHRRRPRLAIFTHPA